MSRRPRSTGALHVVTNRRQGRGREHVTHLLRRSYREGGKVRNETVGNISHLPEELVELVRAGLRGEPVGVLSDAFEIERSLPAGHVMAALAMAGRLELARLLDRQPSRERDLVMAMICQRAIAPASKLATVRALSQSTLGDELGVSGADEDDLYGAMDWLLDRQGRIEDRLARRHLQDGELVLYDVSSSYFEGCSCELAKLGYSRDQKRGTPQIIYRLLCDKPGRPIAVEVFSGELHDDKTLPSQIEKLKARFGLHRVVVVSDRGMGTKANLEVKITDSTFTYQRKTEQITAEAALDGIYVLRTSVTDSELNSGEVVRSYKQLKVVERAFRTFKGPELEIRPIHHRLEDRVRAH